MTTRALRTLAIGLAVGGALLAAPAGPAVAQEYAIHLYGHTEPVKASFYAEEPPWIFFRNDGSQYVFAVGCDRERRVERGGAAIPPAPCPIERLPTTMPRVYLGIMDLEAKRLDDSIARLREQTRSYAQAVIGTFGATGEFSGDPAARAEAELARRRNLDAVAFLQSQIQDTCSTSGSRRIASALCWKRRRRIRSPSGRGNTSSSSGD